jgi:D-glycero-D-manno-heptose 1,7-bisphosphate phosphatase
VLFLDRDGVINADRPDYVRRPEEFVFLPGSLEALARLTAAGVTLVVVTNQSGVGRGLMTAAALERIHRRLCRTVARHGGRIAAIYACTHAPEEGCACRKPEPGLVLQACRELGVAPGRTCLVGDSRRDILCARSAGCAAAVLVATGHGLEARAELARCGERADYQAVDLLAAAQWLMRRGPLSHAP